MRGHEQSIRFELCRVGFPNRNRTIRFRRYSCQTGDRRAALCSLIVAVSLLALVGCGKKKTTGFTPVSGVVTYQSNPVEGAIVSFAPKSGNGRSATATTDKEGKFKLGTVELADGASPGEYAVTIRKTSSEQSPYAKMSDMDEQKQAAKGRLPIPKVEELLPKKYGKAATSGLTATVGDNGAEFTFELADE